MVAHLHAINQTVGVMNSQVSRLSEQMRSVKQARDLVHALPVGHLFASAAAAAGPYGDNHLAGLLRPAAARGKK